MIDCFQWKSYLRPLFQIHVLVQHDVGHTTILPTCLWSMYMEKAFRGARQETKTACETRSMVS